MIDYEYVNRRFEDLASTLLIPAFRRMALTYRATCGDVYTAMELFNELRCVECLEEDYKERIDKYRLRLIRLTKRLNVAQSEPDKNAVMFDKKIYDCKLKESMVTSYHCLAQSLGDHCIETVPAQTIVRSIDFCDRNGFSIVEFMLMLCLFFSIQGRSVGKLNMPINTENELKRARVRFRKIKEVLFSEELERVLINMILDCLAEDHQRNYADRLNRHLTDYWLPERRRHLKTAHYAVKRYSNLDEGALYKDADYDKLSVADKCRLQTDNDNITRMQWLFFVVLPLAEAYMDDVLPPSINDLTKLEGKVSESTEETMIINIQRLFLESDRVPYQMKAHIKNMPPKYYEATVEDYLVAQRLGAAIKGYVGEVRKAVVVLLETLPEAQIAGDQGLLVYLSRL